MTDPDDQDFSRGGERVHPRLALARAVRDTGLLTNLVIQAYGESGPGIGVKVVDAVARLWSTRTASHLRLRLVVTGLQELLKVRSQAVIVLNHESLLDFCLSFFAVGGVVTAHGRRLAPRFVAAKDHFIDNPLIYSVLGVGRAIEAAGMIFVDRKHQGAARRVVDDAVAVLEAHDVDVAIFPQGTRARPHRGPSGRPYGAGYYTTARGLPGKGHFRKGAALIATKLAEKRDVDIVCVGVVGTAAVIPAGKFEAFPGHTVQYHVLPPIHLAAGEPVDEDELTRRIELQLRRTAQVHDRLLRAWQNETRRGDAAREALAAGLGPWDDRDDPVPFAVLDAILSQPPARRAELLGEFDAIALRSADDAAWEAFRERVAGAQA